MAELRTGHHACGFPGTTDPAGLKQACCPTNFLEGIDKVVIPICAAGVMSDGGIPLGINSIEAGHYPEFGWRNRVLAAPDWQPPYPHSDIDVMIPLQGNATAEAGAVQSNSRRNG